MPQQYPMQAGSARLDQSLGSPCRANGKGCCKVIGSNGYSFQMWTAKSILLPAILFPILRKFNAECRSP